LGNLREKIAERTPDRVHLEQYLDFVTNRMIRCTLLCHAGLAVSPRPLAQRLMKCGLIAGAVPAGEHVGTTSKEMVDFQVGDGLAVSSDEPIVKAGLLALHQAWPLCVLFDELWQRACAQLPELPPPFMRTAFAMILVQCWLSNAVRVRLRPAPAC